MQAMYDLVGDKIQEIFDAQVVDIGIVRPRGRADATIPYAIERGVRFPRRAARRFGAPVTRQIIETRAARRSSMTSTHWSEDTASDDRSSRARRLKSVLFAPLVVGGEVRGRISLQNLDRTDAFTEADVRLLTHARRRA